MKKRMKKATALMLVVCLMLVNGICVSAQNYYGILGDGTDISLLVETSRVRATTDADGATTKVTGYRYHSTGSPNQLIAMTTVSGEKRVDVIPPTGWLIGRAYSYHKHAGFSAEMNGTP